MSHPIDTVAERAPLGGLERWLDDVAVDEVMVNAGTEVWVDRAGRLERVGAMRSATLVAVVEHLLAPLGRRLDRAHPAVDARLPDGSRLCAVIPPVAVDGPCLSIRRAAAHTLPLTAFAGAEVTELLAQLVARRCNVLVSGATSAGKTTLLASLCRLLEPTARLVVLEDVAELALRHDHLVRLETREATPDGVSEVSLAHLVRTALRLRPDRLVVGEVRGAEAVHLLQALNTGHDGSLATVHANSAVDALGRLATLVLQEVRGWPLGSVHHHVARAVDVVVHLERTPAGSRRIVEVAEVAMPAPGHDALAVRPLAAGDRVVGTLRRARR